MKKLVALILVAVMCLALVACYEPREQTKSVQDIEDAINALPKDSYLIETTDYLWDADLDIELKGEGKVKYLVYEAVMLDGKLVASDYNMPLLRSCEIIVLEFEFTEDAESFAQYMAQTLESYKNEDADGILPDWIVKVREDYVVMAKDQHHLDMVW